MKNSREKGKRGERQVRDLFREAGFTARRGQQYHGGPDSPDVVVEELPWLHVEVKSGARINIRKAIDQAENDTSGSDFTPVVFWKDDFRGWRVDMDAGEWIDIVRRSDLVEGKNGQALLSG